MGRGNAGLGGMKDTPLAAFRAAFWWGGSTEGVERPERRLCALRAVDAWDVCDSYGWDLFREKKEVY